MKGLFPGWVLLQWVPLLPLLQGPMGLDWVLGPGFNLPASVLAPVLLSLPPSKRMRMYHRFLSSPSASGLQAPHHHGNETGPLPVGLRHSRSWESRSSMSRMCTVLWPCTPCVGLGMCVHMGVELCVYCCMGVNCGFVFMPVGLGSVYLVSM